MTDTTTAQMSCNSICYEALRVFRNTMVDYVRVRLGEVFPHDHIAKLRKPFATEWDGLKEKAVAARKSGGTETIVIDDYDLLDVGHLFNIFDVYFDKIFSVAALEGRNYPKPVKAKLLGNLKAIKDLRDPLSHPVTEEVSYEEAIGVMIDARQVLLSLGLEESAKRVASLMSSLPRPESAFADETPQIESLVNLPTEDSIYFDFVGRRELRDQLVEWFAQKNNKRCLLAGDGGKGKSAVAYKFARDLAEKDEHYKLIAWLSAKKRKFEDGQTVPVDAPDFVDLESAIDRLLIHYGQLPSEVSESVEGKKIKLFQLLNEFPAFLVIDDIDTVLSDEEVVGFFTFEVPNTQSTVLLTSRRAIPGIKSFALKGFELLEAKNFIESRIELYDLDPTCCPPELAKQILEATDGSPLYMDDLMRLGRILPLANALGVWKEKKGDEARKYALQRELEKLSSDARRVLIAASINEEPVSFAELVAVLSFSEERVFDALAELQTLFLVPKPRLVEGEQRFALNANTRKLVQLVEGSSDLYQRIKVASKALAGEVPEVGRGVVSTLLRQAYLLTNSGKLPDAESLLLSALVKYPHTPDLEGFLGFVYKRWDRYTDATKHFEEAHKLKSKNRETYRHWVKMEMALHEWTRAIAVADKALKLIPDFYEMKALRAECKVRSGTDLNRRLQKEKAFKLWDECAAELKVSFKDPDKLAQGEREISAAMYKTLIICLDCLGNHKDLKEWHTRWQKEHPDDPFVSRQREYIETKRGLTLDELALQKRQFQTTSRPRPY